MKNSKTLPDDIQTLVKELLDDGFTQEQLAAHIGCSQSLISYLLSGGRQKKSNTAAFTIALVKLYQARYIS